jgi:hypothetical protein
MGRRSIKPVAAAPSADFVQADVEDELDDFGGSSTAVEDDDDDDVWETDDDDDGTLDVGPESVADAFGAFTIATLPAKMKLRPLADQSNEWILSTFGRLMQEIRDGAVANRDTSGLEFDLQMLDAAVSKRNLRGQLTADQEAFLDAIAADDDGEDPDDLTGVTADDEDDEDDESSDAELETATGDRLSNAATLEVMYVVRDRVHPDPLQPRQNADTELKDSIISMGILQPITVRKVDRGSELANRAAPCSHCAIPWAEIAFAGDYVIVDGERRWQGAAGVLETIPVLVRDDQGDTYERLKTQLVANTGKPLTPIEEARTFARMLEDRDVGVAALARDIGRPASTVHDRVKLLQLGAWLPWIESGSVSTSMAVQHLVPLRGVPDAYHAEAVTTLADGIAMGEPIADSVDAFGRHVASAYDKYMYPLAKSKAGHEKQPLFNTKGHDEECSCGGIIWGGSWQGVQAKGRRFCANPDWWKPLHAEAKKKERAESKTDDAAAPAKKGQLRLELPAGVPTINASYGAPKGVIYLTDPEGRWKVANGYHVNFVGEVFDPADLEIDEKKLVRVKSSYSSGLDRVGTKDLAAVKSAREKFAASFRPARVEAAFKLRAQFEKLADTYALVGGGVHQLLRVIDVPDSQLREMAELLDIAVPEGLDADRYGRSRVREEWIAKTLARADGERLASFAMFLFADEKRQLPSVKVAEEMRDTAEAIGKKRAPWATTKAPKKAGAK